MVTAARDWHSKKATSSITVTESGMITAASDEHSAKACSPITVTDSGIVTSASDEQPMKAPFLISVTESGMVTATSDEFFADPRALRGQPIDLAFADGLHWWEQTLRDVANLEQYASPDGVILIHDCNPVDEVTSARERTTIFWSGDVWKTVVALRRFRPDLSVHTVDVAPTGLAIVAGLDPTNTVLHDRYDEIVTTIDKLTYADIESGDRTELLGLIPGEWALTEAVLSSILPSF